MPGHISHKSFFTEDGERVTVVEFDTLESLRGWYLRPDRSEARRLARERYYEAIKL